MYAFVCVCVYLFVCVFVCVCSLAPEDASSNQILGKSNSDTKEVLLSYITSKYPATQLYFN